MTPLGEYALAAHLLTEDGRQSEHRAAAVKALQSFIDPHAYSKVYKDETRDETGAGTVGSGITVSSVDDLDAFFEYAYRQQSNTHSVFATGGDTPTVVTI